MVENKLPLTIGMVLLVSLVGAGYYLADIDNTYYCPSKELVAGCFKLSTPDTEIHRRCYYNESASSKYVYCKEGWNSINDYPELLANLTAEPVDLDKVSDEEKPKVNISKEVGDYEYWIVGVEKYPGITGNDERIFKCEYKDKI